MPVVHIRAKRHDNERSMVEFRNQKYFIQLEQLERLRSEDTPAAS